MRAVIDAALMITLVAAPGATAAQQKPDFSGTWDLVEVARPEPAAPDVLVVRQPLTTTNVLGAPMPAAFLELIVERRIVNRTETDRYKLGVEGGVVANGVQTRTSVRWVPNGIAIEERVNSANGTYTEHLETWRLDPNGVLVVSITDRASKSAERSNTLTYRKSADSCRASPMVDLLPEVIGPMAGAAPVWLVDGSAWPGDGEPMKALWVVRRTSEQVRISGRRVDGPGVARIRRGDDTPSDVLVLVNFDRESAIPGGASVEVMRQYAFVPSHVFYPSPGCWDWSIRIGSSEFHVVRDLRAR